MTDNDYSRDNPENLRAAADRVSRQVSETEQAAEQLQSYTEEVEERLESADKELEQKESQLTEKENELKTGIGPTVAGYAVSELAAALVRPHNRLLPATKMSMTG